MESYGILSALESSISSTKSSMLVECLLVHLTSEIHGHACGLEKKWY
jgi:hypothetical protein